MPITPLQFYQAGSYPYPVTTTGTGTAMSVCLYENEPALAILTQTGYEDEIVYLSMNKSILEERGRVTVAPDNERISGMCYNKNTHQLWVTQPDYNPNSQAHRLVAINPETGQETGEINVPVESGFALAWNGFTFVRSSGSKLDLIATNGNVLGSVDLDLGDYCRGISASPWSYVASYGFTRQLVVINLFGQLVAEVSNVPGTNNGIHAVAFDNLHDFDAVPQQPSESGAFDPIGSIHDPEVAWDPEPWQFRHRIYLAN